MNHVSEAIRASQPAVGWLVQQTKRVQWWQQEGCPQDRKSSRYAYRGVSRRAQECLAQQLQHLLLLLHSCSMPCFNRGVWCPWTPYGGPHGDFHWHLCWRCEGRPRPVGHIAHIADGPQPRPEVEPQPLAAREPWFLWQPGDPEYCAIERERLMAAFAQRQAAGGGEGPEGASGGVASSGLEVPSQIPASSATLGGGEGPEGAASATASAAGASGGLGLIIAEVPR